jgi:hypothetical protein
MTTNEEIWFLESSNGISGLKFKRVDDKHGMKAVFIVETA